MLVTRNACHSRVFRLGSEGCLDLTGGPAYHKAVGS